MGPVVILARMKISAEDRPQALRYQEKLVPMLRERVPGFEGAGLWQSANDPSDHLVHYQYSDQRSADAGLKAVVEDRLLAERMPEGLSAPDVLSLSVCARVGRRVTSEVGDWLSMSVRMAGPGYGEDLSAELERIFQELEVLPGFVGGEVGTNVTLPDQVIGLALWRDKQSFARSVPPGTIYDVRLYERVR